jgi:dolichol kinase
MNGAMRAAWGLTAFVVLTGLVLWLVTGRAVFAVFLALGVVTGVGAWLTGRATQKDAPREEAP